MKRIKRYVAISILLSCLGPGAAAQQVSGVSVDRLRMTRNGEYMAVEMDFSLGYLYVEGNRAVLLTPRLVNGRDSVDLTSVGIYGRRRRFYYIRNGMGTISGEEEMNFKASEIPENLPYRVIVPYQEWMDGSQLVLYRGDYGCCNTLLDEERSSLYLYHIPEPYRPALAYVRPVAETEKIRSLSGSAFIDFPVNKTVIYPEYRNNTAELDKILATIDSVRNDADVRITSLSIKGFASPESPYSNNTRLARGRTEALKEYVMKLYDFPPSFISTDFEPEDWEGLRAYVAKSNLAGRDGILDLIDADLEPDAKELKIKTSYPEDYAFLLKHCYPALRHSDYRIEYVIRSFSDVEEIRRLMKTQPQKLSLGEFYLAAQDMEPGSEEFDEVFEIAVRMYPDDPVANLNAANMAMGREDLKSAGRYLDKAGASPEATYARGVYALLSGDADLAERLIREAEQAGVPEAAATLEQISEWKGGDRDGN